MAKKPSTTISEKLSKTNDNLTVNMYDNGFMVEISGRNHSGDWATSKIICNNMDELISIIQEATIMERD